MKKILQYFLYISKRTFIMRLSSKYFRYKSFMIIFNTVKHILNFFTADKKISISLNCFTEMSSYNRSWVK